MIEQCPRCHLRFDRLPGHILGSIAMNTILSFGVMAISLVWSLVEAQPNVDRTRLLLINIPVAITAPVLFLPFLNTTCSAVHRLRRPLADGYVLAR